MLSFRYLAFVLVLGLPAIPVVQAQSSSSNPATPSQTQQPAATQTSGQLTVQARIKARREQRRAAAIHEVYNHRYEAYVGGGYLRFTPGPILQRLNEHSWDVGFTRYSSERFGITVDGRGLYGKAFIPPTAYNQGIVKPSVAQYAVLAGPTYRFYVQPKFSVSGRVMGGYAYGNFSGDTSNNNDLSTYLGLFHDGSSYAASANFAVEYNMSPTIGIRLAPEYFLTGFGSTQQNNLGYTASLVYRFGKQKK
jgi:hypothetical protein